MPEYGFLCNQEHRGCGHVFKIYVPMSEYDETRVVCPECKKKNGIERDFTDFNVLCTVPNTVGSLADKNTGKMSEDEKQHWKEKTREKKKK